MACQYNIHSHSLDREQTPLPTPAKETSTHHQKSSSNRQFRRQPIASLSLHILTKIALQQNKKPSGRQGPTSSWRCKSCLIGKVVKGGCQMGRFSAWTAGRGSFEKQWETAPHCLWLSCRCRLRRLRRSLWAACPKNRLQSQGCNKQFSVRQSQVTTRSTHRQGYRFCSHAESPTVHLQTSAPKQGRGVEMPCRHRSPLAGRCPGIRACRGTFCSGGESS
ncbi:hypothetical protein HDV57DRAFT_132570 [Trichoderma longibrachiatum]